MFILIYLFNYMSVSFFAWINLPVIACTCTVSYSYYCSATVTYNTISDSFQLQLLILFRRTPWWEQHFISLFYNLILISFASFPNFYTPVTSVQVNIFFQSTFSFTVCHSWLEALLSTISFLSILIIAYKFDILLLHP